MTDKVGISEVAHVSGEETDSHTVGSLTQSAASKEQSWYTNIGQEDSRVCVLSSMPRIDQLQSTVQTWPAVLVQSKG